MAFHKAKEYDPTAAFLLNEKQQKLLILELQKIDKLWYDRLKDITRNRLEITTELVRLEDEKSHLGYYDREMDIHRMKDYNDGCIRHMRGIQRELSQDNYNFENSPWIQRKKASMAQNGGGTLLPKLEDTCFITQIKTPKKKSKKTQKFKRRQSNLMKTKVFSVSEPNLDTIAEGKQVRSNGATKVNKPISAASSEDLKIINKLADENDLDVVLPVIEEGKQTPTGEERRYLKQRMATQLVLPTVSEQDAVPQRKMSV